MTSLFCKFSLMAASQKQLQRYIYLKAGLYDKIFISKGKCGHISGRDICVVKYYSVYSHNQVLLIQS